MISNTRAHLQRPNWRLYAPASALLLWACLWLNVNSGFWNIQAAHSLDEWQLLIRAVLPFAVLPVAALLVLNRRRLSVPALSPSQLLMIYGILAAIATVASPNPTHSLYWSVAFLATILAARTFVTASTPVLSARQMLQVTWAVMFVVAAIIAYLSRGSILSEAPSAYGSITADLNGLSRSSGVARWAAVPGLVCIIKAYYTRRPALIAIYLSAASAAFFIVYRMQSRGAIFGVAAALAFALFTSSRLRKYALPLVFLAVSAVAVLETPTVLSTRISEYLHRGQTEEQFRSMTGRIDLYAEGLAAFEDAPIMGRGQWADRLIGIGHVHNSYLEALLDAGILGAIPYVASWIAGWILFFRLQKKSRLLLPVDRLALLEAGTVMMFFTVRSIPETTTANFSVDLLVMIAIYVYLEVLTFSTARKSIKQSSRIPRPTRTPSGRYRPQIGGRHELVPN